MLAAQGGQARAIRSTSRLATRHSIPYVIGSHHLQETLRSANAGRILESCSLG